MNYLDLTLRVDTGDGNGLVVRLVESPAGQAEAPFVLPLIEEEVQQAAIGFERCLDEEESYRDMHSRAADDESRQRAIGDQLFQALFPEPIRDLYYQSLGLLGSRPDLGLRIKLQMGLGDPRLTAVHGLPWECLYRAKDGTFLGRERRSSIARHLDLPLPGGRPSLKGPLRVLVVAAQPRGLRRLPHLERERHALLQLGRRQEGMEMIPLATPTLKALRETLLAGDFHVLHFLGHGGFEQTTGAGLLYLEDEAGGPAPVKGPALADLLRGVASLRLVVLNACQTAKLAAPGPFGGLATALLRAGLPSVVAMQFPISDRAANSFSTAFYRRLSLGDPIDAAVTEGRLAIRSDLPDSAEWATPALFLRAPDGKLFEPRRPVRKRWTAAAMVVTLCLAAGLLLLQSPEGSSSRDRPDTVITADAPQSVEPGAATKSHEVRWMTNIETLVRVLGSAWGVWSLVAFALGIFFAIMSTVIRKARPGDFNGEQTYRFFRLAMVLAFLLALATLITATTKQVMAKPGVAKEERIQSLTLDLKSDDPTQRRQAIENLVPYGGDAAREVVKAVGEEAGVIAAEMMGRATGGDWIDILSGFLGAPPWQTPFMVSAMDCLIEIGQPSIPFILGQLSTDSVEAERLMAEAAQRQAPAQNPNALEAFGDWGFLLGAAGQGMRIGMTRDILSRVLLAIGPPAVPELLDGLESPRLLVQMTSYQVLEQIPSATEATIQRLRRIAARSSDPAERQQILAAIQQLEARRP
ncbi:MAG TPA: CHAT domain-containing protein [Thermoanaerobaculia bacterium]|nr:CHAT domain-containing protein [Thermoanaerobaculia bacterium]